MAKAVFLAVALALLAFATPVHAQRVCTGRFYELFDSWCDVNCNSPDPFCPSSMCVCEDVVAALAPVTLTEHSPGCCDIDKDVYYLENAGLYFVRIDPDTGLPTTTPQLCAQFLHPTDIEIDSNYNILIADSVASAIYRLRPQCTGTVQTVTSWTTNGLIPGPSALAIGDGGIYVAALTGLYFMTVTNDFEVINVELTDAGLFGVGSMDTDPNGVLFFVQHGASIVKYVDGAVVPYLSVHQHSIPDIEGITISPCGLYISATDSNQVWRCDDLDDASSCEMICVQNNLDASSCVLMNNPYGLALDCECNLYTTQRGNGHVVMYEWNGGAVHEDYVLLAQNAFHPIDIEVYVDELCLETHSTTPSRSSSRTSSITPSSSPSPDPSDSSSSTPSPTPSSTPSSSSSPTPTSTSSPTSSPSPSPSETASSSVSPSSSPSVSATRPPSASNTATVTSSSTPTPSSSSTPSPSASPSSSATSSPTPSSSVSSTASSSSSASSSPSPTSTSSSSVSSSSSSTASLTPSNTATNSASESSSVTSTSTPSVSASTSSSVSASNTPSTTTSPTRSATTSPSPSVTPTLSPAVFARATIIDDFNEACVVNCDNVVANINSTRQIALSIQMTYTFLANTSNPSDPFPECGNPSLLGGTPFKYTCKDYIDPAQFTNFQSSDIEVFRNSLQAGVNNGGTTPAVPITPAAFAASTYPNPQTFPTVAMLVSCDGFIDQTFRTVWKVPVCWDDLRLDRNICAAIRSSDAPSNSNFINNALQNPPVRAPYKETTCTE